jgi:hypothetical protein
MLGLVIRDLLVARIGAELIIEKPSMQKVIYKLEKPSEEIAFVYMSFGFALMLMLCGKGMCLMIMNGQGGYNG